MKKYLTYEIQGDMAFAKGNKMGSLSNKTIDALKKLGVTHIVWGNGDFIYL